MSRDLVIAGIRLGKIIGAGATGVVHAGTVLATGQSVAVKIVRPQPGQPQRLVERTVQEGRVGWAVRHPNVVRVYEWGMADGGAAYIVMERLDGENLAERLFARGRLPADEVIAIARQVTRALIAIHAEGGVHRDVKPENVFLCAAPPEKVKLLDLGIVHLGDNHPARLVRTGVGLVVGTLGYLSPEQARGGTIDRRSDLYGLGATLYHALVGAPPHPDGDIVEVLRHIALTETSPQLPDDVPAALAELVRALLSPDPDGRPPDADAVLAALTALSLDVDEDETARHSPIEDPFPAMDEIAEHQQIRAGIIAAVARAIRTGDGPPELSADLGALDQLKNRRRTAAARTRELRRQTTALADELDARRRALEGTRAQLESAQAEVRDRYLQSTAALMEIADSIEGIDRRYLRHYEELDAQLDPDEQAPTGRGIPHALAEMEALHQSRAFFADSQATVRARLRTQHRAVSGINLQIIEIKRELLVVEAERQATLVALEDALRAAEDEVLQLDREIEHQFLRLGFIVQAHQARRQRTDASEHPALTAPDGDTRPIDPVPRRPRIVGAPPTDRATRRGVRPADRASQRGAHPIDRASQHGAAPADRAAQRGASPADRASQHGASPTDRASQRGASPTDRASQRGASPADRASQPGPRPAPLIGRASQHGAALADRASQPGPRPAPLIGRASQHGAALADRASQPGPRPAPLIGRASQHGAHPAARASQHGAHPAARASQHGAHPADRVSQPGARPADRASLGSTLDDDTATNPRHRADAHSVPPDDVATNPRHRADAASDPPDDAATNPRHRPVSDDREADFETGDDRTDEHPAHPGPDDTAPHARLTDATDPDRSVPRRLTAELVSPAFSAPPPLPTELDPPRAPLGAALADRSSHPPPLPPEVWTSADRRAHPRHPCAIRVEIGAGDDRALLTTRDLGLSGAFVFSPRLQPPGTRVDIVLHLGGDRLPLTGQVIHGRPGLGYGLRFDPLAADARHRLERYLAGSERRARAE